MLSFLEKIFIQKNRDLIMNFEISEKFFDHQIHNHHHCVLVRSLRQQMILLMSQFEMRIETGFSDTAVFVLMKPNDVSVKKLTRILVKA